MLVHHICIAELTLIKSIDMNVCMCASVHTHKYVNINMIYINEIYSSVYEYRRKKALQLLVIGSWVFFFFCS